MGPEVFIVVGIFVALFLNLMRNDHEFGNVG